MDDRLLADIACLDPVYADGELGLLNLGMNFVTCFFRLRPVRVGQCGRIVMERVPAIALIQPRSALRADGRRASIICAQDMPLHEALREMAPMH